MKRNEFIKKSLTLGAVASIVPAFGLKKNIPEGPLTSFPIVVGAAEHGNNGVIITLAPKEHINSGKESYPEVNNLCTISPDPNIGKEIVGYIVSVNKDVDYAHTLIIKGVNRNQNVRQIIYELKHLPNATLFK